MPTCKFACKDLLMKYKAVFFCEYFIFLKSGNNRNCFTYATTRVEIEINTMTSQFFILIIYLAYLFDDKVYNS